jgi:phenylacetate-CoA ligase
MYPNFLTLCEKLKENRTRNDLLEYQNERLREIVAYSYKEIKYYRNTFDKLNLKPEDIKQTKDLYKLPIIDKEEINKHWQEFKPQNLDQLNYFTRTTGGTTGTPFVYRISKDDRYLSLALLYRGWGLGGYQLGDPMVFIGGASIDVGNTSKYVKMSHEIFRNIRKFSSFEMSDKNLKEYTKIIQTFKPRFIRGYPTAIHYFSQWLTESDIKFDGIQALFTTSEMLYPPVREAIESNMGIKVFDGYGLNDGGLSCHECKEHTGMHIDTERSVMEIVDDCGNPIIEKSGKIIATTLINKAMPFIRYDTGDIGTITESGCMCGNTHPTLKEILGRSVDILITPDGTKVHGWFFLYTFWKYYKGIKQYQVIQETPEKITIKIVRDIDFDPAILNDITKAMYNISPKWIANFVYVNKIELTKASKAKFIITLENK